MLLAMWGFVTMDADIAHAQPNFVQRTGVANPLNAVISATEQMVPVFGDIDNDGDMDLFIGTASQVANMGCVSGKIIFFENIGDALNPSFVERTGVANPAGSIATPPVLYRAYIYPFPLLYGCSAKPSLADIDNDGDLDLFVGDSVGKVEFHQNTGTPAAPVFIQQTGTANPLSSVSTDIGRTGHIGGAAPELVDIDHDGDLDAFVGSLNGMIRFLKNTGNPTNAAFTPIVGVGNPFDGQILPSYSVPAFVDIDGDGDLDGFVGHTPWVSYFKNTGTPATPVLTAINGVGNPLFGQGNGKPAPTFVDIDSDGDYDAFIGMFGRVRFFENIDPSPVTVADSLTATAGLAATTADVTANDQFKAEGPAANFTITAFTQGANSTVVNNGNNTFTYTPNAGFAGADSFTYTLDDGAGNTAVGTVNVTVKALPPGPAVLLGLNGSSFNSTVNNTMTLTAATVASIPPGINADVYIALQLPNGTLLVMQPGGGFGTTLTPLLSNVPVPDFNGAIFNFTFTGTEPPGNYTWFAALTTPGTLQVIGTLATASFSFAP